MKDFISAKERLTNPTFKIILDDILWLVFTGGMTAMMIFQLFRGVNYVN
jgi:hypothetical protein